MQRRERGLHAVALIRVVPRAPFALLQSVDPGQHLLLHVVDLVLQQVFEAVRLRRAAVPAAVVLRRTRGQTRG